MHKGYTLNYFIDFFNSIPANQWCTGQVEKSDGQHCALGHALRDTRTTYSQTTRFNHNREAALRSFLTDGDGVSQVVYINDNLGNRYRSLGKTPRARILKALRNRKRYGNIFGNKE